MGEYMHVEYLKQFIDALENSKFYAGNAIVDGYEQGG